MWAILLLALGQRAETVLVARSQPIGWSYYERGGTIEQVPEGLRLAPRAMAVQHPYASAQVSEKVVSYRLQFRLRIGEVGTLPVRFEVMSGGRELLRVECAGRSRFMTATSSGEKIWDGWTNEDWKEFEVLGHAGGYTVRAGDDTRTFGAPGFLPQLIMFGNRTSSDGRVPEVFLDVQAYDVVVREAPPYTPPKPRVRHNPFRFREGEVSVAIGRLVYHNDDVMNVLFGLPGYHYTVRATFQNSGSRPVVCEPVSFLYSSRYEVTPGFVYGENPRELRPPIYSILRDEAATIAPDSALAVTLGFRMSRPPLGYPERIEMIDVEGNRVALPIGPP